MRYRVCEIFYSLQGEGGQSGRAAVFCRLAGCNLECPFCDTDWQSTDRPGGGDYDSSESLMEALKETIPEGVSGALPMVVFTGGEPALQLTAELVNAVHREGFEISIETNGTLPLPEGIDWICVSPKTGGKLEVTKGSELKIPYPQESVNPASFEHLDFRHFFIQPIDGPERDLNIRRAIDYCLSHPRWRLSLQLHKTLSIP